MKKNTVLYTSLFALGSMLIGCSTSQDEKNIDYTQYVNPFIGAADNGHTFPGACRPFGMIQTSPVTGAVGWRYCSEYVYEDSIIWGFTQTHLNGTGCMDLGDVLVMPVTGELTATTHTALHRYTFHKADSASLLIDLQHGPAWRDEQYHSQVSFCETNWENDSTLTGHVINKVWVNQVYYFAMKFNRPVIASSELPMAATEKGKRIINLAEQPSEE